MKRHHILLRSHRLIRIVAVSCRFLFSVGSLPWVPWWLDIDIINPWSTLTVLGRSKAVERVKDIIALLNNLSIPDRMTSPLASLIIENLSLLSKYVLELGLLELLCT